ncbi:cell division cycle protein 27 homolog B isoform X2 [Amborella trichopoda]|uniref:cell division cycle protein 27 homolog B isoform X2 n=1 Tax=Amborella trichopoda TaxID=13333 RepID=UPI0009C0A00F|nr:cell division cycle protein 27 homolog B isoform X2 [Amborella trichopoda]|eukprot:XP_020526332.1 cell division cycle protein 27 homolog B isoform X2 [Amborella trichopoda]
MAMEAVLVDCINTSLRLYMYRNATFLCERLCAEFPSEINLQLLASCYLRNNQAYCAYHILKGTKMAQSRYLFALSCFQMDLLREAEVALCPRNEPNPELPNGAAGHYLLGLIYRYTDRRKIAVDHFLKALEMDPFLWAAYEELCILEKASDIFGESAVLRLQQKHLSWDMSSKYSESGADDHSTLLGTRSLSANDSSPRHLKQLHDNGHREIAAHSQGTTVGTGKGTQHSNSGPPNVSLYSTPSPVSTQFSAAPPPLYRNAHAQSNMSMVGGEGSPRSAANAVNQAPRKKIMDEGKLRKSSRSSSARAAYSQVSGRLFSDSGLRRSSRLASDTSSQASSNASHVGGNGPSHSSAKLFGSFPSTSKMNSGSGRSGTARKGHSWSTENFDEGRRIDASDDAGSDDMAVSRSAISVSGDDKTHLRDRTNSVIGVAPNSSRIASGALELLGLLRTLGEAYRLSCMYRGQEALEAYHKLSQSQYATGWVLCQVGKAFFEMVDYLEADRAFSWARRVSPYTLEGMDIYSTVLYHLEEEMRLSFLAQELISTDRLSPQAWCAIGNCFSLQKDHETALKNFQRAVHLNPRFPYAHTLCGHEYVALEDFDNGIKCFQSALRSDSRHYNAWYGLGTIYLRQEKFGFAEHHFRRAFQINSRSSVLMCYLGMALHSLKRHEEALEMIDNAILADKKNPLPMFQKANILFSLGRFDEALKDLEQLKEFAPRESSVYALMGKVYKRLNRPEKAIFHFGSALDLKPCATDAAAIKSAIEKLHVPEEIEDNL